MLMTPLLPKGWNIRTQFLQHIYFIDPHIQLTTDETNTDGSISFLDTLVSPGYDNEIQQFTGSLLT